MSWTVMQLSDRFPGSTEDVVHDLSFTTTPGTFLAIVGPNGAGKSTLLSLLVGARVPQSGTIHFAERPLATWTPRALAQAIGVVPQQEESPFPLTVRDFVAMGRYPHLGAWEREGDEDRAAVDAAIARADLLPFRDRLIQTLSGGERQRTRIARALAQQPVAYALDEPSAALDLSHEMTIFELMRAEADAGKTVILVTHHLNLAARYADTLLLMDRGRIRALGRPLDVITQPVVESVFGWPVSITPHGGAGPDFGAPQVTPLASTPRTL
jgi:iron complex transport system ATP-binding protein